MNELNLYLILLALFGVLLSIGIYCLLKYKNRLNSFLDLNTNIMIIASSEKIIYMNSTGVNFFDFKSIKEFKQIYPNKSISDFFIEEDGCYNKHSAGKKWLANIIESNKSKQVKVKIRSHRDKMSYYFHMQVSKKGKDEYILSFNNITKLESDKDIIRKQADYDALTHIYNRVKFNEIFPRQVSRSLTYGETFSLILFDIDHFKMINDTHGHNVGDKVLVELSGLVKDVIKDMKLRKNSVFTRWGGEEFVILLKLSTLEQGKKLANRVRKEIESYPFDTVKRVTCSFGVTEFKSTDTQIGIFQRVDEALYVAKDAGRNIVIVK